MPKKKKKKKSSLLSAAVESPSPEIVVSKESPKKYDKFTVEAAKTTQIRTIAITAPSGADFENRSTSSEQQQKSSGSSSTDYVVWKVRIASAVSKNTSSGIVYNANRNHNTIHLSHDLYEQLASFPHRTRSIFDGGITKSFKKNGGSSDLSCENQVLMVLLNRLPSPCLDDANNRLITQEKNVDGDYGCFVVEVVASAVCSVTLMDSNINSRKSMSPEKSRRRQQQSRKAHLFPLSLERQFLLAEQHLKQVDKDNNQSFNQNQVVSSAPPSPVVKSLPPSVELVAPTQSPPFSPPPTSSSKTSFSFASSPLLTSPPNTNSKDRSSVAIIKSCEKEKQNPVVMAHILPMTMALRDNDDYNLVCSNTKCLHLFMTASPPTTNKTKQLPMLECLVRATLQNQYVSVGMEISIPFRGLQLKATVLKCSESLPVANSNQPQRERDRERITDYLFDEDDICQSFAKMNPSAHDDTEQNYKDIEGSIHDSSTCKRQTKYAEEKDNDDDDNNGLFHTWLSQRQHRHKNEHNHHCSSPIVFRIGYKTQIMFHDNKTHVFSNQEKSKNADFTITPPFSSTHDDSNHAEQSPNIIQQPQPLAQENSSRFSSFPPCGGMSKILKELETSLFPSLFPSTSTKSKTQMHLPKGALLFGPSGVGKTLLAKQLIHHLEIIRTSNRSSKVIVKYLHCSEFASNITTVVGHNERRLSSVFSSAENDCAEGSSTLLILDDLHLMCPKRGGNGSSRISDQTTSTFLALVDGIGSSSFSVKPLRKTRHVVQGNLVLFGITSNPTLLDPAVRRPGRLDTEIEIPIPDDEERFEILRAQLSSFIKLNNCAEKGEHVYKSLFKRDVLSKLSKLAKGFTGADTHLAIKEATRMAIFRERKHSNNDHGAVYPTLYDLECAIKTIKPSSIRSLSTAVEVPSVRWADVGGMHEVKRLLNESIELPLTHSEMFAALNIQPPRGVLLYGPPGCSKTLLARALATEGNFNFLAVKGPELLSKWLGESERALAGLFRRARQAAPCVIFFDEIDAIASQRGDSGSGGEQRLLSQLLTELDGIGTQKSQASRVVIIGATNRPDLLDSALTRPGRIDRMIYVGIPDVESRQSILSIGLAGKPCDPNVDIPFLSKDDITGGFSGAELIAICSDAALRAIEDSECSSTHLVRAASFHRKHLEQSTISIKMSHLLISVKEMKKQITPQMLEFFNNFQQR